MLVKNRPLQLSALLWSGLSLPAFAKADSSSFGLELQAGATTVTTSDAREIGKSGSSIAETLFFQNENHSGIWGVGIGALSSRLDGSKSNRGVKQDLSLDLAFLDLRYLYRLDEAFSFGIGMRGYLGKGAKYGVVDKDADDFMLAPSIIARYEWKDIPFDPALSLSYAIDGNVGDRNIQSLLVGLSVSTEIGAHEREAAPQEAKTTVPVPLENAAATPVGTPQASASPKPDVLELIPPSEEPSESAAPRRQEEPVFIEPIIFSFASGSAQPSAELRAEIGRFAKALVADADAWAMIELSGHTDKIGSPALNQRLSKDRADAFCKLLNEAGVPLEKMTCVGEGSQRRLPGLPYYSSKHRRIEAIFQKIDQTKAAKLKDDIKAALQR